EDRTVRLAELRRSRQHAEGATQQLAVVVLEEDERGHRRRFSCRNARICSAAEPSSSIVFESPRGGGEPTATTVVRDPFSPTRSASAPSSARVTVSCVFFFAPMIPLSDGYRGSLIASETATTAGSAPRRPPAPPSAPWLCGAWRRGGGGAGWGARAAGRGGGLGGGARRGAAAGRGRPRAAFFRGGELSGGPTGTARCWISPRR